MSYLILGFITGMSLILALGPQNIFVIEQGLKKEFIFIVCLICSLSDVLLIFLGISIFYYFQVLFTPLIEFILNLLLLIFLLYFIWNKISSEINELNLNISISKKLLPNIIFKTLGFTYLNPHVYSDTVFFLGNFSKSFLMIDKYYFGIGASMASCLFFFGIGYLSKLLSKYLQSALIWKRINLFIIIFMSLIAFYVLVEIVKFFS